jgi:hypothetical protein
MVEKGRERDGNKDLGKFPVPRDFSGTYCEAELPNKFQNKVEGHLLLCQRPAHKTSLSLSL